MKRAAFIIFLALPVMLLSSFSITDPNAVCVNDILFNLDPYIRIKIGENLYQELQFTTSITETSDGYEINFTNQQMDLMISIIPVSSFQSQCRQVQITAFYKQDLMIRDIALNLDFTQAGLIQYLKGPGAIHSGNGEKNKNLYPYTDKVIEYKGTDSSFWLAGSNYAGCEGIEAIIDNSIKLYDHTLHLARLYSPPNFGDKVIDQMPVAENQMQNWSFLIFETKPLIMSINR